MPYALRLLFKIRVFKRMIFVSCDLIFFFLHWFRQLII
jgi:hypothetical protein